MSLVTVIINNRNLLQWPKAMCEKIMGLDGLHEIIIIDNGSTNKKLLQWYKACPFKVIFMDNLGHTAPWVSGVLDYIETDFYVVSDPDLDLSEIPRDTLIHLHGILNDNPHLGKVGLSLSTDGVPKESPYFEHVLKNSYLNESLDIIDGRIKMFPVDTTFALYDKKTLNSYKICGARTIHPYTAKHLPWYVVTPDEEYAYYLDCADSASSSYLKFTEYKKSDSLLGLYNGHKSGKVSTKWSSYFDIYEQWLDSFKDKNINLLEIGVQNGGSLEIWSKYFKKGSQFIGVDINPSVANLTYTDSRIKVLVGDSADGVTYEKIKNHSAGGYDIIIDDGSHHSINIISNFINYFPMLKDSGIYIVEDTHCAYWPEYGGGYFNARSAAAFFRAMFDYINVEHCREDFNEKKLFQTFFENNKIPEFIANKDIYSLSVYNSVYVLKKSSKNCRPSLGEVVVVGDQAAIDARVMKAT